MIKSRRIDFDAKRNLFHVRYSDGTNNFDCLASCLTMQILSEFDLDAKRYFDQKLTEEEIMK